jgi:hypothetical protein
MGNITGQNVNIAGRDINIFQPSPQPTASAFFTIEEVDLEGWQGVLRPDPRGLDGWFTSCTG